MGSLPLVSMETIRVIVVDEQPLIREGIRVTLAQKEHNVIVSESACLSAVLDTTLHFKPNVALISADLVDSDPLEIVRNLHNVTPELGIILLSLRAWVTVPS